MRPLLPLIPTLTLVLCAPVAQGSVATVPDDFPTVQLAIDSGADSVMIREGSYPERIRVGSTRLIMGLPGAGARPRMQGLVIEPTEQLGALDVTSCAFDGAVELQTGQEFVTVTFDSCSLDSGIVQPSFSEVFDYQRVAVYRSRIRANVITTGNAHCEADTFLTGSVVLNGDVSLTVVGCRFEGAASRAISFGNYGDHQIHLRDNDIVGAYQTGIVLPFGSYGEATGNRISGCLRAGIDVSDDYVVSGNRITNCLTGIVFSSSSTWAVANTIRDCGTGMSGYFGSGDLKNNLIVGSQSHGIDLGVGDYSNLEGNVVGRSGGDGMRLNWSSGSSVSLRGNTSYRNGGAGFRILAPPLSYGLYLRNSVAFENQGFGVDADTGTVTLECNDLHGNLAGAARGVGGLATNLDVDPLFCDVDHDSVTLAANSPLLDAPGCGLIGARGLGCASTPTLVTLFTVERVPIGVRMRWQLGDPAHWPDVWVERASVAAGPWAVIATEQTTDGGVNVGVDRSAHAEHEYWYRLVARERSEVVVIGQPLRIGADVASRFQLVRVSPNPASGPLQINFTLAYEAPVEVDVFDVQGRHLISLVRGSMAAGSHVVEWSGLAGTRMATGLQLVRYRYPGGKQVLRFVRVR